MNPKNIPIKKDNDHNCPNCDAEKPAYREECPECHYIDKGSKVPKK